MVAALTNRAVIAILVTSATQNVSSGDMLGNSAKRLRRFKASAGVTSACSRHQAARMDEYRKAQIRMSRLVMPREPRMMWMTSLCPLVVMSIHAKEVPGVTDNRES
jgi:hypothetical protein